MTDRLGRKGLSPIDAFRQQFEAEASRLSYTGKSEGVLSSLHQLVGGQTGQGHLLVFPLSRAAKDFEFIRAALGIIAPDARVVTLVTPQSRNHVPDLDETEMKHLRGHLDRILSKELTHPHTIHVMDFKGGGKTNRWIQEAARGAGYAGSVLPHDLPATEHAIKNLLIGLATLRGSASPRRLPPETPFKDLVSSRLGWFKSPDGSQAFNLASASSMRALKHYSGSMGLELPDAATREYVRWIQRYHRQLGAAYAREYVRRNGVVTSRSTRRGNSRRLSSRR